MIPFCNILPSNKNKVIMGYSLEFELLKMLETRFNFKSYFIDEHNNWGIHLGNGTWSGSVGKILNEV